MQEYHILNCITGRNAQVSFHTPGHKGDYEYSNYFPFAAMDLTELSYTDDLSCPTGAIAAAQCDIAKIVGAQRSYITTDGSSSGVMAMIYALSGRGGKLIIQRNSHKSVWNACRLFGVEPVIVQGETRCGVMLPPTAEQIERHICADQDIIGAVITSPDYYGNIADLKGISRVLKAHNKVLIVDGAHGGHLAFDEDRQGYAGVYADMWVDGVHKSMPALTQGALVHISSPEFRLRLEEGLNIFRTTSPSFPIMASVEYSVKYCADHVEEIKEIKRIAADARRRIEDTGYKVYPSADWTKLAVDVSALNLNAALLCKKLEKDGIYAEFTDGRYVLFYLSPCTAALHLDKLVYALECAAKDTGLRTENRAAVQLYYGKAACGYLQALSAPYEYVQLERAAGRVSAANVGVAPPCIPLAAAGEVITPQVIQSLKNYGHCFGVEDGKIKVVKL